MPRSVTIYALKSLLSYLRMESYGITSHENASFFGQTGSDPNYFPENRIPFSRPFPSTHSLTHGVEPFLRSRQLCSYSRASQHFMEPSTGHILSQINPIHVTSSYLRSILTLSTHVRLGLPSGLFPSGFPADILYTFLFSIRATCPPCPSHPLDLTTVIVLGELYKL
jgi:hypothetical protein